jgi:hypothetical protein
VKKRKVPPQSELTDEQLLDELQRRSVLYFWETADPRTGLVKDRASNFAVDDYTEASTAATGYGLAALAIGADHGWLSRSEAETRARDTLQFLLSMPNQHGWMLHFVDKRTGQRTWNSEYSSIDTALLLAGAIVCSEFFSSEDSTNEISVLVDTLYRRIDWWWLLTNGDAKPEKRILSQGWYPESQFIGYNYGSYSEAILLYLLGLGAPKDPLPKETWDAIARPIQNYHEVASLQGGPIFIHQMPSGFFNFRNQRDRVGYDYWVSSTNAMNIHRQFCLDRSAEFQTYAEGFWGLNASDGPKGYTPYGATEETHDGTVSPTGAISSIPFTPALALSAAQSLYSVEGLWGKYGFANAFNIDRNWFSQDVIGIDLGMALLSIENYRTGLVWTLMHSFYSSGPALRAAGFHLTLEPNPRPLYSLGPDSILK